MTPLPQLPVPLPGYVRIRDLFAHIGLAVALAHASMAIATVYGTAVNLQIPLPHYPHNRIITRWS